MANTHNKGIKHPSDEEAKIPMAAYCRFSCDQQRAASIEDQRRNCVEGGPQMGGFLLDGFVYTDEGKSGTMLKGRTGLRELMDVALIGNAPFRGILLDDTSRLGRNLSDTLPLLDQLQHAGIIVYFVMQRLDSRDPNFRQTYVTLASHDEQYSRQLAKKVHRGQRGRVLAQLLPTGQVFGYDNVPVTDPLRKGKGGRPAVIGVNLVRNDQQAGTLIRMFTMRSQGYGPTKIAKLFNAEGLPSTGARGGKPGKWYPETIRRMLANEKYRGVHVWNKTTVIYNPNTGKKEVRDRPEHEWETVEVPAWRVVPEELWQSTLHAMEVSHQRFPGNRQGGLSNTRGATKYLLSGLLTCGHCGGNISIIKNREGCTRYVCTRSLSRVRCEVPRSIHQATFESRLFDVLLLAIRSNLPAQLVNAIMECQSQKQSARDKAPTPEHLRKELDELDSQTETLLDVITRTGTSTPIENRLRELGAKRKELEKQLSISRVEPPALLLEADAQGLASVLLARFTEVLLSAPDQAKAALPLYLQGISITHFKHHGEPFVRVETNLEFFLAGGRGKVEVPFAAEISAVKAKGKLFDQKLLDQICAHGDEPVAAQTMSKSLGVSRSTVGRWCGRWGLPFEKVGFNLLVRPSQVREFLSARNAADSRLCIQVPVPVSVSP